MSAPEGPRESGQEVLVVDGDRNVLRLLERLLGQEGLTVTSLSDPARARDQIEKRFVAVVLCDLDTPYAGGGMDLVQFARDKSPLTAVILMTARKSFDAVAPAFRSGARDVVPKTQDAIPYIREQVMKAVRDMQAARSREELIAELAEMHEEFLKKMMEMSRQVIDLEDKLLTRDDDKTSPAPDLTTINVLLVDDDAALSAMLVKDLPADKGWRIRYAQSGGEALDSASQAPPQILVVNDTLPDLPASMVVKTIKGNAPDAVALLFSPPTENGAGEVRMVDASRLLVLIPSFSSPDQLVAQLEEIRQALRHKAKERRYLQLFRKQHFDFLKKYNGVKQKL